ncbi:putative ATP-dependent RNA helicase DDX42 [Blattamonas nauphoetae]|uniref:ATP-dependent RNA helicase DDX42 n=1 Tax=Blattamonas nauphoetae TaxID=2049346 RepID=A0ABQ9Y4Q0_9EUKA|nr:putative ATP-dependent RNA helicase DDX42 [Blattamonas nauphoetae]
MSESSSDDYETLSSSDDLDDEVSASDRRMPQTTHYLRDEHDDDDDEIHKISPDVPSETNSELGSHAKDVIFDETTGNYYLDPQARKRVESLQALDQRAIVYPPIVPFKGTDGDYGRTSEATKPKAIKSYSLFAPRMKPKSTAPVSSSSTPSQTQSAFSPFHLHPKLLKNLTEREFHEPTPVQLYTLPLAMANRDVLGTAPTGSGKTLAYLLPALSHAWLQKRAKLQRRVKESTSDIAQTEKRLDEKKVVTPFVVILAPTRELVQQIQSEAEILCRALNEGTDTVFPVTTQALVGGESRHQQVLLLRDGGADVIIATPGRLIDMLKSKAISFFNTTMIIMDEADRMLSLGFHPQIVSIMGQTRADRRIMMFSATFRGKMERLAEEVFTSRLISIEPKNVAEAAAFLEKHHSSFPVESSNNAVLLSLFHSPNSPIRISLGLQNAASTNVVQHALVFPSLTDKLVWLVDHMEQFTVPIDGKTQGGTLLIFCNQKGSSNFVAHCLQSFNHTVGSLHGDRDQSERHRILKQFQTGKIRTLIATDVAGRGLDIPTIRTVVSFDAPTKADILTHRVGRTGRLGTKGVNGERGEAYTLFCEDSEADVKSAGMLGWVWRREGREVPEPVIALSKKKKEPRKKKEQKLETVGIGWTLHDKKTGSAGQTSEDQKTTLEQTSKPKLNFVAAGSEHVSFNIESEQPQQQYSLPPAPKLSFDWGLGMDDDDENNDGVKFCGIAFNRPAEFQANVDTGKNQTQTLLKQNFVPGPFSAVPPPPNLNDLRPVGHQHRSGPVARVVRKEVQTADVMPADLFLSLAGIEMKKVDLSQFMGDTVDAETASDQIPTDPKQEESVVAPPLFSSGDEQEGSAMQKDEQASDDFPYASILLSILDFYNILMFLRMNAHAQPFTPQQNPLLDQRQEEDPQFGDDTTTTPSLSSFNVGTVRPFVPGSRQNQQFSSFQDQPSANPRADNPPFNRQRPPDISLVYTPHQSRQPTSSFQQPITLPNPKQRPIPDVPVVQLNDRRQDSLFEPAPIAQNQHPISAPYLPRNPPNVVNPQSPIGQQPLFSTPPSGSRSNTSPTQIYSHSPTQHQVTFNLTTPPKHTKYTNAQHVPPRNKPKRPNQQHQNISHVAALGNTTNQEPEDEDEIVFGNEDTSSDTPIIMRPAQPIPAIQLAPQREVKLPRKTYSPTPQQIAEQQNQHRQRQEEERRRKEEDLRRRREDEERRRKEAEERRQEERRREEERRRNEKREFERRQALQREAQLKAQMEAEMRREEERMREEKMREEERKREEERLNEVKRREEEEERRRQEEEEQRRREEAARVEMERLKREEEERVIQEEEKKKREEEERIAKEKEQEEEEENQKREEEEENQKRDEEEEEDQSEDDLDSQDEDLQQRSDPQYTPTTTPPPLSPPPVVALPNSFGLLLQTSTIIGDDLPTTIVGGEKANTYKFESVLVRFTKPMTLVPLEFTNQVTLKRPSVPIIRSGHQPFIHLAHPTSPPPDSLPKQLTTTKSGKHGRKKGRKVVDPLLRTDTAWRPKRVKEEPITKDGRTLLSDSMFPELKSNEEEQRIMEEEKTQELIGKSVSILNKLSPKYFDVLTKELVDCIQNERILLSVIDTVFDKAVNEAKYVRIYTALCAALNKAQFPHSSRWTTQPNFRRLIIQKCQTMFEQAPAMFEPTVQRRRSDEENEAEQLARLKFRGMMGFVGELQVLDMNPDAPIIENIEAFIHLLTKVGKEFDTPESADLVTNLIKKAKDIVDGGLVPSRTIGFLTNLPRPGRRRPKL